MKKKETEIATNVSSGAEKVEVVEKEVKKSRGEGVQKKTKTVTAKGDAALGDSTKKETPVNAKKVNEQMSSRKAEAESEAAKKRVQLALKRKEAQAKRKEEKEKRKAEKLARRKKRLADKKAKEQKRMEEREAERRERAHAKANKHQARAKKKAEKRRQKPSRQRESRVKGYGGWIAAVVALGVTSLALATTVTVGGVEMSRLKKGAMSQNKATMYELTGIMGHMDDDLERARISNSPVQQGRILTDLLVQTRLAEADLEKLPISHQEEQNITVFINRTAMECERMLAKLRRGEGLNEQDTAVLESLYTTNHAIRQELDGLLEKMTDKDIAGYLKGEEGMVSEALGRLESLTLEENRAAFERKKAEMQGVGVPPVPQSGENTLDGAHAVEMCKQYFNKYKIADFQCVGETVTNRYSAYNVQGYDDKGTMLFAEIDRLSGALVGFEYFEDCTEENFDIANAEIIAMEFLDALGYEDMELVKCSESGSTAEFTFLYEDDGVVYYPDEVRVKVCRTRGLVTGMDATRYLRNHRGRDALNVKIPLETAYNKLHKSLTVESSRVAVVQTARGERAAYEILCSYQDTYYYVYIDAETGDEIAIINAQNKI